MGHSNPVVRFPHAAGDTGCPASWRDYLDLLYDSTDTSTPVSVCSYASGYTAVSGTTYWGADYSPTRGELILSPHNTGGDGKEWVRLGVSQGEAVAYTHGASGVESSYKFPYLGCIWAPKEDKVFFTPGSQHSVYHYMDCKSGLVSGYGATGALSKAGHYGGAYDPPSNRVWLAPALGATGGSWPAIDCAAKTLVWAACGMSGMDYTQTSYFNAVYAPSSRRVYYVPCANTSRRFWHYADCSTGRVVEYAHGVTGQGVSGLQYAGGAYDPVNDRVYLCPRDVNGGTTWHYIEGRSGNVVAYEPGLSGLPIGTYQFGEGVYSPLSRRLYLVPKQANGVTGLWYYIDTMDNKLKSYKAPSSSMAVGTYSGGCFVPGVNRVYFSPGSQAQKSPWHYIQENCSAPVPLDLDYHVKHTAPDAAVLMCLDEAEVSMLCYDGSDGKGNAFQLHPVSSYPGTDLRGSCLWATSDSTRAVVSPTGVVSAVAGGAGDVTISCAYAGVTSSCLFTVYQTMPAAETEGSGLWLCKGGSAGQEANADTLVSFFVKYQTRRTFLGTKAVYKFVASSGLWWKVLHVGPGTAGTWNAGLVACSYGATFRPHLAQSRYLTDSTADYSEMIIGSGLGARYAGSVYTDVIKAIRGQIVVNGTTVALTQNAYVGGEANSSKVLTIDFNRSTRKITMVALTLLESTSDSAYVRGAAEVLYVPQNYVRYADRAVLGVTRANYTVIPNIGTLGSEYDLTANKVPTLWFGV